MMSTPIVEPTSKMAVWILNHYAITPDMPGGTRHHDLARNLVARGYDVTILASSFHHMTHTELRLKPGEAWKVEEINGVRFVWLKTFPYQGNNWRRALNMLTYMVRSYRYGSRLPKLDPRIPRPDVIVGSTVHLLAVLSAYRLARRFKCRFIMEVRDIWPQTPVEMGRLSKRHPVVWGLSKLEKFLYRRAEKIITVLPNAAEYITQLGIPQEKLVWVPNGVEITNYAQVPPYKGGDPGNFTILYLGTQASYHGLGTVLEAANLLRADGNSSVHFLFVGDGPDNVRLRERATSLGLDNVEFRPPVPKSHVPQVLGEADAMMFTFRDLPVFRFGISPLKVFDYLASLRPILYSVRDGSNMVEAARAGITVPPENPEALAQAIKRLLAMSREERIQMGLNGYRYVKANHDMPVLAEKLDAVFRCALAKKPRE
ncbi:MAG: glycosyltransferase family 4 protein [Dehalococcoidia bacterium]|nr:glycosyltransferase family 4 protein [Dehalococcoidia bacterium]